MLVSREDHRYQPKEIKVLGLPVAAEAADAGHWSHIHYQRVAMQLLQKRKA
jgi:hypothetical protein